MPITATRFTQFRPLGGDQDGDGFADSGDILRHTLTLNNTGTLATGVTVNDLLGGSTLVGNINVSPIAFGESFTAVGNTLLEVGNATSQTAPQSNVVGNILTNDVDFFSDTFTISAFDATSFNGGTVNVITTGVDAGSFTYVSAANFTGIDTFTYTIRDDGLDGIAGNSDDLVSIGTVTVTVSNQVWYVDNSFVGVSNGTSTNPFTTLAAVTGATGPDTDGDTIYVNTGSGNYTGGITLLNNQVLHGEGTALVVGGFNLAAAGTDPTIANAAGNGVTLAQGNTLTGFTVGNTTGFDIANTTTSSVGTLTISNVDLTGTGGLFRADAGGALNVTFDTASTTSATAAGNGIQLTNVTGSFTATSGAISGVDGIDVLVSGGTATINIGSSITSSVGGSIDIGTHAGNVTLSGAINITGGTGISVHGNTSGIIAFTNATKVVSTAGNNAVDLDTNTGATVNFTGGGLDIDTTTGFGFQATGGGTFSVTGSGNSVTTTTGTALDLNGMIVGVNGVTFATATTNGAANGILVTSVSQSAGSTGIDVLGGAIVNATTRGVDIISTSADVSIASTISTTAAGRSVEVTNSGSTVAGGNTIVFSGAIDDNGLGINLDNNDQNTNGATINFTGGLDIDSTTNIGFNAINGGTINVTGANNTIDTTTGIGLNVVSTNIGASDLNFLHISSNGAASGIVLNTTGALGGLTVTGDGGTTANGSGGVIQNSTGSGISLTNTRDIVLDQINISGSGGDGITGTTVVNFSLTDSNITNSGNADEEHGIDFLGVTGDILIVDTMIRGSFEHNFKLTNTSGTINTFNVKTSVFDHTSIPVGPAGGNGLVITLQGTAVMTDGSISGSTFRNNFSNGILVNTENTSRIGADNATSGSTDGFVVSGNTFDDNNIAIQFGVFHSSDMTVDIQSNTIINDNRRATSGANSTSTAVVLGTSSTSTAGATLNARVESNIIGDAAIDGSGSSTGNGIRLIIQGLADVTALINSNTIREAPVGFGFDIESLGSTSGTPPTSDVTVTNNNVDHTNPGFNPGTSDFPLPAIYISGDNQGTAGRLNVDVRGNTVPAGPSFNFTGGMIELFEYTGPNGDLHLVDNPVGPGGQTAAQQLQTSNTGSANTSGANVALDVTGALPQPPDLTPLPLMASSPPPEPPAGEDPNGSGVKGDGTGGEFIPPAPGATDPVWTIPGSGQPTVVDDGVISQAELALIVEAAIQRWADAGATEGQLAAMRATIVTVENMSGLQLGSATAGHITVDDNAAGFNWFIDATPDDDSEYNGSGSQLHAIPGTVAAMRVDLLTTIMHELGHQIGLLDSYASVDNDELMYGLISAGERRLPGSDDLSGATGSPVSAIAFSLTPINIGNIPAGQVVVVMWDSSVNGYTNQLVPTFTNFSTITGNNPGAFSVDSNSETMGPGGANNIILDSLTLGGTIWLDNGAGGGIAGDGLINGTEAGINGVTLALFADANNDDVPDTPGTSLATLTTAGGGNYSFTGLAPGNYIVRVDAGNFTGGGALLNRATTLGSPDPDDNTDSDDNGFLSGGAVFSNAITLSHDNEPIAAPGNDTNNTLDFGFVAPNQPPTQTDLQGDAVTWTEGDGAVLLDDSSAPELAATITDPDSANFDGGSLIVTISVGAFPAEEGLFIQSIGNITSNPLTAFSGTVSFMGTEFATYAGGGFAGGNITFTFDVDATPAAVQALVRAMSYNNNGGDNPTAGTRLVSWTLNDGDGNANGGNPLLLMSSSIDVAATNDNPVIADLGGDSVTYVEEAPAILLDDSSAPEVAATVTDPDSADFNGGSVTVSITANEVGAEDVLGISTAGTVTLSSGTSVGSIVSVGGSAIGTITANGAGGNDLVIALNTVDATPGRVTTLVQALTYANTNTTSPSTSARTVAVTVADGDGGSDSETVTVNVTDAPENAAPVVDLDLTDLGSNDDTNLYVENSPSSGIGTDIAVTDTEGDNVLTATITITDPETGDLLFANLPLPGGITIDTVNSTDTTMILIGSASAATYATALGQVGFTSSSEDPTDGGTNPNRVITVTASDAGGTGPAATMTLTVAGVNDEPTLIATGLDPTFPENTAAVDLYSTVTADTIEGGQTFASMTLTVTNVFDGANEILTFDGSPVALTNGNSVVGTATNGLTVTVAVTGSTATVTFTGATLSEAALQTLVDALTYVNTAIPPTDGDRVITITQIVDSGSNTGANDNVSAPNIISTVDVEPNNQAPAVDLDNVAGGVNYTTSYTEDAPGVAIGSGVTVTDPNFGSGDMIESATIVLTDRVAGDALTITGALPPGIVAVTTPTAGAITIEITGPGTGAQYQALIESIQYSTTSQDPTVGGTDLARTITVTVNDGTLDSAVATTTVNITPLDDAAVAEPDAYTITESGTIVSGNLFADNGSGADSDPDGPPIVISAVSGGAGANVGTQFTLDSGALLTVNANGTFDYDPNGIFLPTPTAGSGASNTPSQDSFTYTLAGGNEVMVSITLTGLDTNDLLLGTPGVDTLIAGVGNDTINGLAGADSMTGGPGNDVYIVDNASDTVVELSAEGDDIVYAVTDYALGAGQEVEILSSFSIAWTSALNLTGNDLSNIVVGNYGDNVLGGGFGGVDVLSGFLGNDTYFVDSDDIVFDEEVGGGTDIVYAISDYVLTAGQRIETLSAYSIAWTSALNLTGNTADNILAGTFGDNVLNGGFGGLDVLNGFAGNDTYIVDADDVVFEAVNEGNDIVYAVSNYVLTSGSHVEILSAFSIAWTSALDLTGNEVDNVIVGTAGANFIDGRQGNDYLVGFAGADTFAFTTALNAATNVDFIEGFGGASGDGDDFIALDDAVFTGLAPGVLSANAFVGGTAAADADDRIIYDGATGRLYFDADGNGAGAQILFATLDPGASLTAADFIVI